MIICGLEYDTLNDYLIIQHYLEVDNLEYQTPFNYLSKVNHLIPLITPLFIFPTSGLVEQIDVFIDEAYVYDEHTTSQALFTTS